MSESEEFISEELEPLAGAFDASAMARGEPGLPEGFRWRDAEYRVVKRLGQWKATSAEGGRAGGQVYLRRHYFELRMDDGSTWTVYCLRQVQTGRGRRRWHLYTRVSG